MRLKHLVVLDVVAVAAGFVLRAIGGAVAVDVPDLGLVLHRDLLRLAVGGHRQAGRANWRPSASDATTTRAALGGYPEGYLGFLRTLSSAVVLVAYCLWAFETAESTTGVGALVRVVHPARSPSPCCATPC